MILVSLPNLNPKLTDLQNSFDPRSSATICLEPPPLMESGTKRLVVEKSLKRLAESRMIGAEHVGRYVMDLYRRNCSVNTIRGNFGAIFLFLKFVKALGREKLENVTNEDLSAFIEHEQDRGLKPLSVHTYLRVLNAFFNFLIRQQVIGPDVFKRRLRIKIPDALPRAIDPEDIKQLLAVVKKVRDRALVLVLLRTGMRIGELLNTRVCDVNLKEKRIDIFQAQKDRTGRVVYLSDDARQAVKKWFKVKKPQIPYVFYGHRGRPLGYEAARAMFNKYIARAGLAHKGYTLHCLRHTCASELLNAGMRLECLQQLLGHSDIEMTRRYARLTDNTRKEEYFKAMAIIERGNIHGHYRRHHTVP